MDEEEYKELHLAIVEGDLDHVRRLLPEHTAEQYFSYEDTSALYKAFYCEEYEIASYLIHKGAKIHNYEVYDLYRLRIDLTRVNYLLFDYNKRSEKSSIFRLLSYSQSPQGMDGERLNAVMSMYEEFFNSEILKLLMDVLEYESFDIVYDFESEDVNRIHRLYEVECEIYGLTLSNSKEIFVGAKHLLSGDSKKKAKVYGVVAEELCHLALTNLFENNANPYREEHSKLSHDFVLIMKAVKSLLDRSCHVESVIKDVFENYEHYHWECELIARVPHVIGIYGEELGRRIFLESPELSRLLIFYEQNVLPKCHIYSDPSLNTKPHRLMEKLMNKNNFISLREKQVQPLKDGFPSFREFLVDEQNIFIITTNCIKLCTLQVYHELKCEYEELLEKKCLFFARKCFEKKRNKIRDTLKGKIWEYLILMLDENELSMQIFEAEYLDHFHEFITKGMKIIMIAGLQSLGPEFQFVKTVNYKWNDLTDEYQHFRTWPLEYIFKGERECIYIQKEDIPNIFSEKDIIAIISGELTVVNNGAELFSHGYVPETYVMREFWAATVDKMIFHNLPDDTSVFISGLSRKNLQDLSLDESRVQFLQENDESIEDSKSIFIIENNGTVSFDDFERRIPMRTNIWLHHEKNNLYLKKSSGIAFKKYVKEITLNEKEMLNFLERKRIIIISDNAGYGKSTVISSLIRGVRENNYQSWLWKIDFNKFSMDKKDPLSLANLYPDSDEEEVFDYLFLMLGFNNGLEKYLFRKLSRIGSCFIFFDGFDEIPSKYKDNALKLLSTLSEKTKANVIITTRKHHQLELELLLNTYSHQLVPFSRENQVRYLGKLWKSKLKYPNGEGSKASLNDEKAVLKKIKKVIEELKEEMTKLDPEYEDLLCGLGEIELDKGLESLRSKIDSLNFQKLAENVLDKTLLQGKTTEFMEIPLHLYMIGIVHYNGNFNVKIQSDIYCIYSQFMDQKILIYLEEKQGLWHDGRVKDKMMKMVKTDAYRIHIKLADQIIEEGKSCLASELDEEDLELCSALGIVFIHCGEINFLHQTFAEFLKAESLMQELKKEAIIPMLFEDRYNVVRRFLSNALEKRNFNNLTKEFFKDVEFLIIILERIVGTHSAYIMLEPNVDVPCLSKLTKKLLENFESVVGTDLVDKFIEGLQRLVKSESDDSCVDSSGSPRGAVKGYIGSCFTAYMLKYLLTRYSNDHIFTLFTFVRYCEDPLEVIDVLKECISYKMVGGYESSAGQREIEKNEKKEAEHLLELFNLQDSKGYGLVSYALCNDRAEIFAHLLKFFQHILGKEQFVKAIIQSVEYRDQMERFIATVPSYGKNGIHLNRICRLFKGLYSVFRNEIEILFDSESKFWVIDRVVAFDSRDEWSNSFEKIINLFYGCFGSEELKEFLLSRKRDGDYLTQDLMWKLSNRTLMKYLNVIKDTFDDRDKMKQLLMSKNRYFKNMLHVAALQKPMYVSDLLLICEDAYLKDVSKETSLCIDEYGNDLVNYLARNDPTEILKTNLKSYMDQAAIHELLTRKAQSLNNMFLLATYKRNMYLYDVIQFCSANLEKEDLMEMIISNDECGDNVIHILVLKNSFETIMKNLKLIQRLSGDEEWLKDILKTKGQYLRNVFHLVASRDMYLDELMRFYDSHLGKYGIQEMLLSTDEFGNNVMHYLFSENSHETLSKNLKLIKELFGNDDCFKDLLMTKSQPFCNIIHFAANNRKEINLGFLQYYLCDNEIADLLTERNNCGQTCLQTATCVNLRKFLALLGYADEMLRFDRSRFIELILAVDDDGNTFLHCFEEVFDNDLVKSIFSALREKLSDEQLKELLRVKNKKGQTFLQIDSKFKEGIIKFWEEILEKDMFEELL